MTRRVVQLCFTAAAGFGVGLVAAAALNPTEMSALAAGTPACPRCRLRGDVHAVRYPGRPAGNTHGSVPGGRSVGPFADGQTRPAWHCTGCRHSWGDASAP